VRIRVASGDAWVRDDGAGFESPRESEPGAGMGLELVAGLAKSWGSEREGGTTVVWFEVDPGLPDPPVH
jgi:hypothetical protein